MGLNINRDENEKLQSIYIFCNLIQFSIKKKERNRLKIGLQMTCFERNGLLFHGISSLHISNTMYYLHHTLMQIVIICQFMSWHFYSYFRAPDKSPEGLKADYAFKTVP